MSSEERTNYFNIARILYDTQSGIEDAVEYINRAVRINSLLDEIERQLLATIYKKIISPARSRIKSITLNINPMPGEEDPKHSPELTQKLNELKQTQIDYLLKYSNMLIDLIDNVIKPSDLDAENAVYYIKLKADYYRYICEAFAEGSDERKEYTEKAIQAYKDASNAAKQINEYSPTNLGLVLNHTVFLSDIVGDKEKALEIAKKVYDNCAPLIDQNNELGQQEAENILKIFDENINAWKQIIEQNEE